VRPRVQWTVLAADQWLIIRFARKWVHLRLLVQHPKRHKAARKKKIVTVIE
jgi:hypothetical protein